MTSLTVGICAYNEAWNMHSLLNNITQHQNLPSDAEVIVVASGCKDGTPEIVKEFMDRDPRVRLIEEDTRLGKASAVNLILKEATGNEIVFLSADVTPGPNCLLSLRKAMSDTSIGICCGRPVPVKRGPKLVLGLVETLWGFHNWQLEKLNDAGLLKHASEIFCIRGGIVKEVPGGIVNDDAYMAVVVKARGYLIKYVPESRVGVFGPQTVGDYVKQRRRIIAGHFQLHEKTGQFSQFLFYSVFIRPRLTFKLLVEYFAGHHRIASGIATALVEVASNVLAGYDIARGKSHAIWDISTTTKMATELTVKTRANGHQG